MSRTGAADIWVFCDTRNRRFFGYSLNVLAGARKSAGSLSGKTGVILAGSSGQDDSAGGGPGDLEMIALDQAIKEVTDHGADRIFVHDHPDLAEPRTDVYAPLISHTIKRHSPGTVMFPLTDFTRELAAMCARLCDAGLIADCSELSSAEGRVSALCPSWGGEIMASLAFTDASTTGFITVKPHAFKAEKVKGAPGEVNDIQVENPGRHKHIKILTSTPEPAEHRKLEDAEIVVAGGAGLGNIEGFGHVRELAAILGAEVGATRPPVLQHWVDEDRLIGQTGKMVRPRLLLTIGTSGAVQYTAGFPEAETIVAVNRDENAPIFQTADIGIVDDIKTFLPLFIEKVKRVVMRDLADRLATGGGCR